MNADLQTVLAMACEPDRQLKELLRTWAALDEQGRKDVLNAALAYLRLQHEFRTGSH